MEHSNSYRNKLIRKTRKYSHMLLQETGINSTSNSKYLMVCNAGLVSGIDRERIVALFANFASIQRVVMVPQKSYCFVQCVNTEHAERAFSAIHGKLTLPEVNGPVYLLFTETIPEEELPLNYDSQIEGLILTENFVSEEEEQYLLNFMDHEFKQTVDVGSLKHRSVKHYGYEFNYQTNYVHKEGSVCEAIPNEFNFLLERIQNQNECQGWIPEQITVNKYLPGQGIPPHIDTHSCFDDFILSLSLGSDVCMDFKNKSESHCSILLPRKSLLIMENEARYAWTHGITPRKYDVIRTETGDLTVQKRIERISFTFRKLRKNNKCDCIYKEFCDSSGQTGDFELSIDDNLASELEKLHVHEVYEEIANHFSETRHKPWPNVENFVKSFDPGSIFVDVGCGNGKYFNLNANIFQIGCDRSLKLSEECRGRGYEALNCNCLDLPFRTESIDCCICIAVIHHLSTMQRRLRAVKEIARILRKGGQALIYVWAKNQKQDEDLSSYLKQRKRKKKIDDDGNTKSLTHQITLPAYPKSEVSLPVHVNRTQFKFEDMLVPWKLKKHTSEDDDDGKTFLRYYHVFEEKELEYLCRCISGIEIIESYYDQGNWCVKFRKTSHIS